MMRWRGVVLMAKWLYDYVDDNNDGKIDNVYVWTVEDAEDDEDDSAKERMQQGGVG